MTTSHMDFTWTLNVLHPRAALTGFVLCLYFYKYFYIIQAKCLNNSNVFWCSICIFLLPKYERVAVFMLQTALVKHILKFLAVSGI